MKTSSMCLVSIIVPVYNGSKTIKRCIDSITNQTFSNIEIIVVDDGSDDDTISLIESFNDPRIRIIKKKHSGVSRARNSGLVESRGDYLMFVDGDDTIRKDTISKLVRMMEADKSLDLIKFGYSIIKDRTRKTGVTSRTLSRKTYCTGLDGDKELLLDLFFRNADTIPCYSVTLFFRKRLFDDTGLKFHERLYMMEDAVFYLELFEHNIRMKFISEPFYNYYYNNESASRSRNDCIHTALGALASCNVILNKLKYPSLVSGKYFRIIFEYYAKGVVYNGTLDCSLFDEKYKMIAAAMDNSNEKMYWRVTRNAVLKERRALLIVLAYIFVLKDNLRSRK